MGTNPRNQVDDEKRSIFDTSVSNKAPLTETELHTVRILMKEKTAGDYRGYFHQMISLACLCKYSRYLCLVVVFVIVIQEIHLNSLYQNRYSTVIRVPGTSTRVSSIIPPVIHFKPHHSNDNSIYTWVSYIFTEDRPNGNISLCDQEYAVRSRDFTFSVLFFYSF